MRKFYCLFFTIIMTAGLLAQTPQKMSYQAVIRNANNVLIINHNIGIRVSILQGSSTGTPVYVETHSAATNSNGLVSIEIGGGNITGGTFSAIDWSSGLYFIKLETDPAGGSNYTITGTSQLLSVPYALHAEIAENSFSGNYNDLSNKPVLFDGNYNSLTNLPVLFNGTWASLSGKPTTIGGYGITDAMTTGHPANAITQLNITNWETAYSWGNHAASGYLTSLTEAWKKNNNNIYFNTGNVGIGTDSPTSPLTVSGIATFVTSLKTPSILPLDGNGASINIKTNNVSNANAGDISIISGSNSSPQNGYGRGGDVTIAGGDFAAPFPTGGTSSRAGSVTIRGGATPNGGGGVGFPGNILLNGGEGGTNARGGAIVLQAGSGNTGGNINLTAGAGVGPGNVIITGGTSTTLNLPGNVIISGGSATGGGAFGNIIFNTSSTQQAVINNTGNFGIGTASPVTKLDVNGVITASGGNSANWNAAYGWGNHALMGYVTANHTHDNATPSTAGFMSGADKAKLDGLQNVAAVVEATDEFTAAAAQTAFTLTHNPSPTSKVKMYINGIRISNTAYTVSATSLTYIPANNGGFSLATGDRIQFDYSY